MQEERDVVGAEDKAAPTELRDAIHEGNQHLVNSNPEAANPENQPRDEARQFSQSHGVATENAPEGKRDEAIPVTAGNRNMVIGSHEAEVQPEPPKLMENLNPLREKEAAAAATETEPAKSEPAGSEAAVKFVEHRSVVRRSAFARRIATAAFDHPERRQALAERRVATRRDVDVAPAAPSQSIS